MSKSAIRVGVVGLGAIGQRLIRGFSQHSDFDITAVCDVNEELAARTAAELGAIFQSTDYKALLAHKAVDLIYIAVPPKLHRNMVLDTVGAKKHILCEKPLAINLAEAGEMVAAVSGSGLVHAMNLPLHYAPGARTFARHVAEGYVGEVRRLHIELVFPQWPRAWQMTPWVGKREQGGAIREVGPHLFHQVLHNFGPVRRVLATMQYPLDPEAAENGATGLLELASGQVVSLSLMCNLPRPETVSLTVYGTEGALGMVEWTRPVGAKGAESLAPLPVDEPAPAGLLTNLAAAIRGGRADLCGLDVGLQIQALLEAWERSVEAGDWAPVGE